ncbi:PREDICTED: uncharacterized protein LOC107192637 [Dufourea novaeangliae]|uniref:uncharacterized protein LOC107192637 n=1 Tax=Dufourea novaeangliae TaxID=178035 RepID=UPI00076704FA|nr:PREDICTED: uncharacterized protein LOC107192637 [Dufourea novaeangliae]
MIDRFILLEEPLKATIAIINKNLPHISNSEWEILPELAVILKPIESATRIVSGEQYPTASVMIPLISGLKNICEKLKQKDFSLSTQQIISHIEEGILNRFENIENNNVGTISSRLGSSSPSLASASSQSRDIYLEYGTYLECSQRAP